MSPDTAMLSHRHSELKTIDAYMNVWTPTIVMHCHSRQRHLIYMALGEGEISSTTSFIFIFGGHNLRKSSNLSKSYPRTC